VGGGQGGSRFKELPAESHRSGSKTQRFRELPVDDRRVEQRGQLPAPPLEDVGEDSDAV